MTPLQKIIESITQKIEKNPPPSCIGACDAAMAAVIPTEFHQPPCPVWKRSTLHNLISRGVSERAARLVVSGLRRTKALERASYYETHEMSLGKALILAGTPGTGKTVAAVSILLRNDGLTVQAAELQRIFLDDVQFSKLKTRKLVVIDDLGQEHRNDFFLAGFDLFISARHGKNLPLVVTTNLNLSDFKIAYGDRIHSRTKDWGKFYHVKGEDMRGKNEGGE